MQTRRLAASFDGLNSSLAQQFPIWDSWTPEGVKQDFQGSKMRFEDESLLILGLRLFQKN